MNKYLYKINSYILKHLSVLEYIFHCNRDI